MTASEIRGALRDANLNNGGLVWAWCLRCCTEGHDKEYVVELWPEISVATALFGRVCWTLEKSWGKRGSDLRSKREDFRATLQEAKAVVTLAISAKLGRGYTPFWIEAPEAGGDLNLDIGGEGWPPFSQMESLLTTRTAKAQPVVVPQTHVCRRIKKGRMFG